jgi:putative tricarboxylic transport membrane protein
MDFFHNFLMGFGVAFQPMNLFFCFIGVLAGTLVGVLPGIGPTAAIALLLPVTFAVTPVSSIIMLAGILYGAMYGGSTTSILVNIPGESASIVTCIDGYQMARQGRAGPALAIAAWGSFIAGTASVIFLMFIAEPLAKVALAFSFPEYFALMVTGLMTVTYMARHSMVKALMMAALGILIGGVGLDMISGLPRFTFGINELSDGVGVIPLIMGVFGVCEVLENIEREISTRTTFKTTIRNLWPTFRDWADSAWAIIRGTFLGFFIGILPGGSGTITTFISYTLERKLSKHPERFGKGAIEGVAGPESANNASCSGGLVPLMSLGIPPNATMALLFAALVIHGIQPGPTFIAEHPDIFWGLIASMYVGNIMLLVLNLPLVGLWVQILKIPYHLLFPLIVLFCIIGTFSIAGSTFDLEIMLLFGVMGYLMRKFRYEGAPLILAYVLGPLMEQALRQSLLLSGGSFTIFVTRPISAVTLAIALFLLVSTIFPNIRKRRDKLAELEDEE